VVIAQPPLESGSLFRPLAPLLLSQLFHFSHFPTLIVRINCIGGMPNEERLTLARLFATLMTTGAMSSRFDLPLELLPTILEHLPKVHYLTNTALVNHTFYQSTIPLLYTRVSIYSWHKDAKRRVRERLT
jgi:hypothetical protein